MTSDYRYHADVGWRMAASIVIATALSLLPAARAAGPGFTAPERVGLFLLVDTLRFPDPADGVQYTYHGPRSWAAVVQVYPAAPATPAAGTDPSALEAEAVRAGFDRLEARGEVSGVQVMDEGARQWTVEGRTIEGRRLAVGYRRDALDYQGFIYVLAVGSEVVKIRMLAEGEGVKAREADRFIELAFAGG